MDDVDRQHELAFGNHTGIVYDSVIDAVKDNLEETQYFSLHYSDAARFTDLAWKLLGRYIGNNTHLDTVKFDDCGLTNVKMTLLFGELVSSSSCRTLSLLDGAFDVDGLRNLVPFLGNSPEVRTIMLDGCRRLDTECFELLIQTLHYSRVEILHFEGCNIKSISALDTYNLPCLEMINLSENRIGREGCMVLSNLLQKESTTLSRLYLMNTDMGDHEAEVLADSLKHNTQLRTLYLHDNNDITKKGYRLFFKLVNDISSIEKTYDSNQTLNSCKLVDLDDEHFESNVMMTIQSCIDKSLNEFSPRDKVINSQLDSQRRKLFCKLQGIADTSNIFAEIEPLLLPRILALIGSEHGQSELYTALKPTAPELLSYIDRRTMILDTIKTNTVRKSALANEYAHDSVRYQAEHEQKMAEFEAAHKRRMASLKTDFLGETTRLSAHNNELNNRLKMIESSSRSEGEGNGCKESRISGKKRPLP